MFAFKILLLILSCVPFAHLRLARQPWSRRSQPVAFDNCICYDTDHNRNQVSKLLDPDSYGVERLVIYVYKLQNEDSLKVFIPNAAQQRKIPDLPFDSTEIFDIDTESLQNIYETSSEKIPLYPVNQNAVYSQQYSDITFKPGLVNEYNYDTEAENDQTSTQVEDFRQFEFSQGQESLSPHGLSSAYFQEKPIEQDATSINSEEVGDTNSEMSFSKWFDLQLNSFKKEVPPHFNININGGKLQKLIQNILAIYGLRILPNKGIIDENGAHVDLSKFELRPIFVGSKISHLDIFQNSDETVTIPKTPHYLEGLLVMYTDPSKILGMIPLRKTRFATRNNLHKLQNKKKGYKSHQTWQATNEAFDLHSTRKPIYEKKLRHRPIPTIEKIKFGSTNRPLKSQKTILKLKTKSTKVPQIRSSKKFAITQASTKPVLEISTNPGILNSILNSASKISKSISPTNLNNLASNLPDKGKVIEYLQVNLNRRNDNTMPKEKKETSAPPKFNFKQLLSVVFDVLLPSLTRRTDSGNNDLGNLSVAENTTKVENQDETDTKSLLDGRMATVDESEKETEAEITEVGTEIGVKDDTQINPVVETESNTEVDAQSNTTVETESNLQVDAEDDKKVDAYDDDEPPGVKIIGGKASLSSGSPLSIKGRSGFIESSFYY